MLPRRASGRLLLAVYAAVGLVVLAAEVAGSQLAVVAGWFTIPLLAEALLVSTDPPRPRPVVLLVVSLLLFAAGNVVTDFLPEDLAVPVLTAFEGVGLVLALVALAPLRGETIATRRRSWLVGYALFYLVIVFAVRENSGALFVPLLAFGAVALAVAVLATALGVTAGFGGLLVVLSSALAVMHRFTPGWDKPGLGFWIQLTQLFGLAMLTLGALGRWQAGTYGELDRWSLHTRTAESRRG